MGGNVNLDELEDEMIEEEGVSEEIEKAVDEKKLKSAVEALVNALSKVELPDKAAKALTKLTGLVGLEYGYGYGEGYPTPEKTKTEKSLLDKIRALVAGEKVKKANSDLAAAFETSLKVTDISNAMWQLQDIIRDILKDNEGDKIERIKANLDAFQAFVTRTLEKDGVEKALESLEKAGRKISRARLEKLKETHGNLIQLANVLAELIQEAEAGSEEGGTDVTKEELDKAMADGIKQALAPIEERIAKLEKAGEELTKSIEESIKKAVDPLTARVETIEKARQVSQSIPDEVQKANTGTFSGVIFGRKV